MKNTGVSKFQEAKMAWNRWLSYSAAWYMTSKASQPKSFERHRSRATLFSCLYLLWESYGLSCSTSPGPLRDWGDQACSELKVPYVTNPCVNSFSVYFFIEASLIMSWWTLTMYINQMTTHQFDFNNFLLVFLNLAMRLEETLDDVFKLLLF